MEKPWLGAQEALYESLLWHLKVPENYQSQVAANRLVFPAESMVNAGATSATNTSVELEGNVQSWVTDMESATSLRPMLYGFDFGRVVELSYQNGSKELITTQPQNARAARVSIPSEKNMMKDLMLSCFAKGGEVCISYHMLNPFIAQNGGGDPLKYTNNTSTHLNASSFQSGAFAAQSGTVTQGCEEMGRFLNEILGNSLSGAKDIYVRLLHEPNIDYFWWGEAGGTPSADYLDNFIFLWNTMSAAITNQIDANKRARIKFVFCMNGKQSTTDFQADLDRYFPTTASLSAGTPYATFINSIAVLGLDYYEDWLKDPATSQLIPEYIRLKAKVADVQSQLRVAWEHALTEVSIRTGDTNTFKGRLYGKFNVNPSTPAIPSEQAWAPASRHFFEQAVFRLAIEEDPKWVMFWVNRLGNSAISSITPSASGGSALTYGVTNLFTNHGSEFYYPMLPAQPFYVETFSEGHVDGNGVQQKTFVKFSTTDPSQLRQLVGTYVNGSPTDDGDAYLAACVEFSTLVPQYIQNWNSAGVQAVEAWQGGALSRPNLTAAAPAPNPTPSDVIFQTL